jgi:hypothetical protein
MENLHLKNLDLSKVKKQVQENKIKSIVEKTFSKITIDSDGLLMTYRYDSDDENNIMQPKVSHLIAHRFDG